MTIQRPPYSLVSVTELLKLGSPFFVADYQRGYKWTALEIEQLLEDLRTFRRTALDDFYCLQPLAVAWNQEKESWELIDGQQRLTTLFLILKFLKVNTIALIYATRHGSREFLENIASRGITYDLLWESHIRPGSAEDNIDNFHFFDGYKTISKWFAKIGNEREAVVETLLTRAKFIWHEVTATDFRSVFLHLNSGKIPLTEAELIKAHFLRTPATEDESAKLHRQEMAHDWDRIEYTLRNDAFWFFLKGAATAEPEPARITFIFKLIVPIEKNATASHPLFFHYAKMGGQFTAKDEWGKVKSCFHTLEDWFEDRKDYHLLGFLCTRAEDWSFRELLKVSRSQTKSELQRYLRSQVLALVHVTEENPLSSLSYERDHRKITDILLLVNILSLPDGARFPFHRYHEEEWSLEHIHARNPKELRSQEEWENWANYVTLELDRWELHCKGPDAKQVANLTAGASTLKSKVAVWLASAIPTQKEAQREVLDAEIGRFTEPELNGEYVHSLRNLALLSGSINSALNNSHFDTKRKLLIDEDRKGRFIPIVTKNAFLKYYKGDIACMHQWTPTDQKGYFAYIEETLRNFCHE